MNSATIIQLLYNNLDIVNLTILKQHLITITAI